MKRLFARWPYRARQFFTALLARVSSQEMGEARRVLGPDLYRVFERLPRQYRLHALKVYRRVAGAGCADPVVWQGALLHDMGKYDPASGRYVTVLHRVAVVLLHAVPPGRAALARLSRRRSPGGLLGWLLYPFYLSRHHAWLGAQIAEQHGAPEELVRLIARHHVEPGADDYRLRFLQTADDRS